MKRAAAAMAAALIGIGVAVDSSAQTMLQIRVLPGQPKAGDSTTLVGRFDLGSTAPSCNVRVDFGDDTPEQDVHIKEATELPLRVVHVFAQAGDYVVAVRPIANGAVPPCSGGNHSTLIEVLAP